MYFFRGLGVLGLLVVGTGAAGCATNFVGDAHVPGGAAGCNDVCHGYGMDLAGMVAMGEYSDGCICKVRGQVASNGDQLAVAGAVPAAVGVVMAMRARQQQQSTLH